MDDVGSMPAGYTTFMTLKLLNQIERVLHQDFRHVRKKVQLAMKNNPKSVTLLDALKQQEQFNKCKRIPPDYESGER